MPATTRPVHIASGERRRPRPAGQPGYLRVDTVHQGDLDGIKGLYHLNLVDEAMPCLVNWRLRYSCPLMHGLAL